jgi:O-antigen ligase
MNTTAETVSGWTAGRSLRGERARLRDTLAPLSAVVVLLGAHFLFGAEQAIVTLVFAGALIALGVVSLAIAGPRHVTVGMAAGMLAIWGLALSGWAGDPARATPELAALTAAGAMWAMGFVSARQRGTLDAVWAGALWSSLLYCLWYLVTRLAAESNLSVDAEFPAMTSIPVLLGLFALVGCARVLHVMKHGDSEGSTGSEMLGSMVREGLGGVLLLGFAMTCLVLDGSEPGVLLSLGVLIGYAWWDTRSMSRDRPGFVLRFIRMMAPLVALLLAAAGIAASFDLFDLPGAAPAAATADHAGRLQAYYGAFLEKPVFGYGLGTITAVGQAATTLHNAEAMLAPGGARNAFLHLLVETGIAGAGALMLVLAAMHMRIARALKSRRIPRTFLRLCLAASALMLLHGAATDSLDLPGVAWFYALILGAACGVASLASKPKQKIRPI